MTAAEVGVMCFEDAGRDHTFMDAGTSRSWTRQKECSPSDSGGWPSNLQHLEGIQLLFKLLSGW